MTQSVNENKLTFQYTNLIGEQDGALTIVCTNWRNPITLDQPQDYGIKTFDVNSNKIDESSEVSILESSLQTMSIPDDSITYSLESSFPGDESSFKLSF